MDYLQTILRMRGYMAASIITFLVGRNQENER